MQIIKLAPEGISAPEIMEEVSKTQ